MIQPPTLSRPEPPSKEFVKRFKLELFYEFHAQILIVWFLIWLSVMVHFLQITLIPLLEASQAFILIGIIGFFLAYALRKWAHFSLLDGLYYNLFGVAPFVMAVMLWTNASCTDLYLETHRTTHFEPGGSGFVYDLENDAYSEFWRIRNFERDLVPITSPTIKYTFCDGLLGYKVMKDVMIE